MTSSTHPAARLSRRTHVPPTTRITVFVVVGLVVLGLATPLAAQPRSSGEPGSAAIRISGGVVRIGSRPAGSLRSLSDRGGLARIIGDRLQRAGDPRASRFGPDVRNPHSSARRPLRDGFYDPYPSSPDHPNRGSRPYTYHDYHDRRYETALPVPAPPFALGRAYDLGGPPSFTAIRVHDERLVRGGFRLDPLPLPTLVVFVAYPVWRGSLFDDRSSR